MLRRLPPLNALKAFEAAARHQSFTRATEKLCVTQGAVSHVAIGDYLSPTSSARRHPTLNEGPEGDASADG